MLARLAGVTDPMRSTGTWPHWRRPWKVRTTRAKSTSSPVSGSGRAVNAHTTPSPAWVWSKLSTVSVASAGRT